MTHRVAASLAPTDTQTCLELLHELAPVVGLAEVCLDTMDSFDLPCIVRQSPCPLIITCRPPREGGHFAGSEAERLAILGQAMALECAYIDVEWDSAETLLAGQRTRTKVIVSRHWFDHMPAQLVTLYEEMRGQADVVKLVGTAQRPADVLPVLDFLRRASSPVIGLAMGEAGRISRLLAPCFPFCLLTYGAYTPASATAPGQLTLDEMVHLYHLHHVGPHTHVHLYLCANDASANSAIQKNAGPDPGQTLHLPWRLSLAQASQVSPGLRSCLPHLTLTADPALEPALRAG